MTEVEQLRAELSIARQHIEALEDYVVRVNTCVKCECSVSPDTSPPHCEDCVPADEQVDEWENGYLENPVRAFRAKFGKSALPDGVQP